MDKNKLTKKQEAILTYIRDCIKEKGYPPAVREICAAVGLSSTSSVHSQLKNLEDKGYIRRDPAKNRSIEIIDEEYRIISPEIENIPIVGTVTAGEPILAVENITGYFPISPDYLTNNQTFMLKVRGESMINAHIMDGDILIIEKRNTAVNGEIVVALLDDSATVKRFFKEDGHIRLQPENDSMDPIIVQDCMIIGRVLGLFRTMK